MKLSEFMANRTPSASFVGEVPANAWVLAVDCGETPADDFTAATVADFAIVGDHISGIDAQLNPETSDKNYLLNGKSTMKTANQLTFAITGDRYEGDDFQDFALSHAIVYGVGSAVVRKFVRFNVLNGKGVHGEGAIIVNSDGTAEAGSPSAIDIAINATTTPTEFTYSAAT